MTKTFPGANKTKEWALLGENGNKREKNKEIFVKMYGTFKS